MISEAIQQLSDEKPKNFTPVIKTLRTYGNYSETEIKNGFVSENRDVVFPKITKSVNKILLPWLQSETKKLPKITLLELSKMTRFPAGKLIKTLQEYPLTLKVGELTYITELCLQEVPDGPLSIKDGTRFGISPQRLTRLARYQSRPPGGGPVQKTRIQENRIKGILKPLAQSKGFIKFVSQEQNIAISLQQPESPADSNETLNTSISEAEAPIVYLGPTILRSDIKSSEGPFQFLPEYKIQYPEIVSRALINLFVEYNSAFTNLARENREWSTDYQYCFTSNGAALNRWVQVDMPGLTDDFLENSTGLNINKVTKYLRGKIFEMENSVAMYQLSLKSFPQNNQPSIFENRWRFSLDGLREKYGRPIALLAVTQEKYQAMRAAEFGKRKNEPLLDIELAELSGFDRFFGPDEFWQYLIENKGNCGYLLYVRSSDPVAKLKNPNLKIESPLLEKQWIRKIIKANSLTFNIDNPAWPLTDPRRINDTKAYLTTIEMGYPVTDLNDIQSIANSKSFPEEAIVRAKPMRNSYGCYGHLRGYLKDSQFRRDLKGALRRRGDYILQPEQSIPIITNEADGKTYAYMDRVFLYTDGVSYGFMGGFRYYMSTETTEFQRGRMHANEETITAEVIG